MRAVVCHGEDIGAWNGADATDPSMSTKQMLINYVPGQECRVALVVDGALEEFHTERANSVNFVGNIYLGTVTNVEPGIQAAFIDFGQSTNGFLHVSDLHPMYFPGEDEETTEQIGKKTPRKERPPIQRCLRRGQKVIVQVLKESINTKGPTLTTYLSIPGRYLVMLPQMDKVGVSRKVEDDDERRDMRKVLDSLELPEGFGFIMRTAGAGKGKTEIKRDLAYLARLHKDIERRKKGSGRTRLLYAESDLLMRCLRDIWTSDVDEIVIDHEPSVERASKFMKIVSPRSSTKLKHYDSPVPMFHAYGIEEQIQRIYSREVPLPSGGSLVIDETEAMIAIDVNSGKMRDAGDAETTAYKTNCEAVDEICRQLRLRDIGGLVVCDLIDMHGRGNRRKIESQFRDRLKKDRAATRTLPISRFGIVEMTRQRVRGSMRDVHFARCPTCTGRGLLQRPESVVTEMLRDLAALMEQDRVAKVELVVSSRVAGEILSTRRAVLSRIELSSGKHIDVRIIESIPADRVTMYAYDSSGADIDLEKLPRLKPPKKLKVWESTDAASDDWAVDINEEAIEEALPEPEHAAMAHVETDQPDDSFLNADDEEEAPKKKRRRRRRRRKSGSGDGESEEQKAEASRDDAEEQSDTDDAGEGEGGRRKRRRRRRRGRGGSKDDQAPAESNGQARSEPDSDHDDADDDEGADVPDPAEKRGDSWDLTPEEVAAAEEKRAKALAALHEAAGEEGATDGGGKKKRRRSRRRKSDNESDGQDDAPASDADASDESSPEDTETKRPSSRRKTKKKAAAKPDAEAKAEEDKADDADQSARKVTRRRKKKTTRSEPAEAQDDESPADANAEQKPAAKKKSTRKRRSKKKTGSSDGTKSAEPTPKSERMTKSDLEATIKEEAAKVTTKKATTKKPRTLYSSRRRVNPTELSKQRRDRD